MEEMVKKYFDLLQDIHTSTRYMVIVCIRSFCFYLEVAVNLLLAAVTCQYLIFMNGKGMRLRYFNGLFIIM